jgi:hypothetical protein
MAETQGIELKLENGNVIKAENAEEALKVAAKMIEDNSKYARETKAALDTVQSQFQTVQIQLDEMRRPKETNGNGFNKDEYYRLLSNDPLAAQTYMDRIRFGVDDPVGFISSLSEKITKFEGQSLGAGFAAAHPEFPNDDDSAKTMTQRVQQLVSSGHPADFNTMELAWHQLVTEEKLKPIQTQDEREEAPPSLRGAGGVIGDEELTKAEQMDTKQLEAFLRSKGVLK